LLASGYYVILFFFFNINVCFFSACLSLVVLFKNMALPVSSC